MIQVIDQNDQIPARILPPSAPVQPVPTDEAVPLRVSGIISWITVLVLCLFAAANY